MLNNTRYLHIMLNTDAATRMTVLNQHLLKRKYPGEHVALVRQEDVEQMHTLDLFEEIHALDCTYLQKAAFSPLLGDATAFSVLWDCVYPLTQSAWARVFNMGGSQIETAVASLFNPSNVIGTFQHRGQTLCQDSPLKLAKLLADWNMSHPVLKATLHKKSLQQLDFAGIERALQQVGEIKSRKTQSSLETVIVGIRLQDFSEAQELTLGFLSQIFTVVALNTVTRNGLAAIGINAIDWSDRAPEDSLFLDLIVHDSNQQEDFWQQTIDIRHKSSDELTNRLAEILPPNLTKWSCLSFLFDYLGQPKLALQSEKILTRYDRQALQPFLYQEVLNLRDFAKIMLEGLRKQGTGHHSLLQDYWATRPAVLSFVSAIELSLSPSLFPMFRNDQDVISVKNRLRLLNGFYERIHRACTLDIPKTDLALTL
jgi:hypothetical protein